MKDALHLELNAHKTETSLFREARLKREGSADTIRISYEMVDSAGPEYPDAFDGFVFAVLLYAMRNGAPLSVHGPVSRSALYNLEKVQSFWLLWRPGRYKQIEIIPERIVDLESRKPGRRTIAAFSGGVDSTFTVLRHARKLAGNGSHNLDTVLMVHGFDVNLANANHFEKAKVRAQPFLKDLGITLRILRTNSKELKLQNWEDSHACQLAGCLHQFSDEFEFGLIGSSGSYMDPELPNGSNPVADHLLSGDAFNVVYDGAGQPRPNKIEIIAEYPIATAGLRVCWEGAEQYRNCGRCGKCVRVRLAFLAAGYPCPACFDGALDPTTVREMKLANVGEWTIAKEILTYAARRGTRVEGLRQLRRRMAAYERSVAAARRRDAIVAVLQSIGMKSVVKRGLQSLGLIR